MHKRWAHLATAEFVVSAVSFHFHNYELTIGIFGLGLISALAGLGFWVKPT